jgi:cyclohexanone monooxygenase
MGAHAQGRSERRVGTCGVSCGLTDLPRHPSLLLVDGVSTPFDAEALRRKYAAEREKRLRTDGKDQYLQVAGSLARYHDDPYVQPVDRAPLADEVDVLVLGGGFGGLLLGARLRAAGVPRIRIVEKGGDFGGTWYWNRYPGAQCDVESYIYLPLLEETGYVPKEKYSHGPEIRAYARMLGEKYDLYRDACFQTEVTELRFDEAARRWTAHTDRGDRIRARFVCMASGPLNRPKLPGIPGIEAFRGRSFHTSRWDYAYTGGDGTGGLLGLADRRVGVIGTGATAVQIVPHLAEAAKHLYVFQRTPSSIDVRGNRPTDAVWASALTPGWQKRRMENFNNLLNGRPQAEDLVGDGWTDLFKSLIARVMQSGDLRPSKIAELFEMADFEKMEQIRARASALVQDGATADALKPFYRLLCKRPCFHDAYLQSFNRPNVTLVDTDGRGVERITEKGVVVGGAEVDLDCVIFATGFEVGTAYTRRTNCEVYGRRGKALGEHWAAGTRTLHSFHAHGFPNLFFVSQVQGGFCANWPHMLDECSRHITYVIDHARTHGLETLEATEAAEADWVKTIVEHSVVWQRLQVGCTPGYYNNEGKLDELNWQDIHYGAGSDVFFELLASWRKKGDLAGLARTPE